MPDKHTVQPYPLRMPPELREWMEKRAGQNTRSLQGELLHRLQQSKKKEEEEQGGAKSAH